MKMTFKAFTKKLFGAKYERLPRTLLIELIVFTGLHLAGWKVQIAPFMLYLMASTFTAGVMWQALASEEHAVNMQNMFMLPFDNRQFIFSYVAALGLYTIVTKTAALLAVLLAVSDWSLAEILGSVVCAVDAVLVTAAVYSFRKYWYAGSLWAAAIIAAILLWGNKPWFILLLVGSGALAVILLRSADGYAFYCIGNSPANFESAKMRKSLVGTSRKRTCLFYYYIRKFFGLFRVRKANPANGLCSFYYPQKGKKSYMVKGHRHASALRYFFRYLKYHKNYLVNTVIMWCVACVMPIFFKQMGDLFVVPMGFAILSLNTPVCVLLSCDPALEQAVRFLPGQKKAFCIPYCLFIFLCNMAADVIFLCSWRMQNGGVTVLMIAAAVFFALQSAVFSVLLEWFYPVRGWKIESDLWHHPRKYIVPAAMLLLAAAVGALPVIMPVLMVLLAVEAVILLLNALSQ